MLWCPSTCKNLSPKKASTPKKPLTDTISIKIMTEEQLNKATDELKQVLYDKFKLVENNIITLNIGGKMFETSTVTLRHDPSCILAILTNRRYEYDGHRNIFIDQDPTYFHLVLNYLRNDGIFDLQSLPRELGVLQKFKRMATKICLDGLIGIVDRIIDIILNA